MLEVVRDVVLLVVEVLVLVRHVLEALLGAHADKVLDNLRYKRIASSSVEGEGLVPVRLEQLVYDVLHGDRAVRRYDDGLLDEVGAGQVDADLVAEPVRHLGTGLCVAPGPVGLLEDGGVGRPVAAVVDGDGGGHALLIVADDGDGVQLAIAEELEERHGGAAPVVVGLGLLPGEVLLGVDATGLAEVAAVLDEEAGRVERGERLGPVVVSGALRRLDEFLEQVLRDLLDGGRVRAGEGLLGKAAVGVPVREEADVGAALNVGTGLAEEEVVALAVGDGGTRLGHTADQAAGDAGDKLDGWVVGKLVGDDLIEHHCSLSYSCGVEDGDVGGFVGQRNVVKMRGIGEATLGFVGVRGVAVDLTLEFNVDEPWDRWLDLEDVEDGLIAAW